MASLAPLLMRARRDPRVFRLPPILSLLCITVGVAWLFMLPLHEYSRRTYVSENALLPGQVHTYFGGSEHVVFRAYRHEVNMAVEAENWSDRIVDIFQSQGYTPARQRYTYWAASVESSGTNVYAMLKGPRADATEAMVLMAPIRNAEGNINWSGVALALTIARYFRRWSLWSKDIIFVITEDSFAGPQAWVDAYHDQQPAEVEGLRFKGGALQGAVSLDYPAGTNGRRFDRLEVIYDGVNGQLPNLDLINSFVDIMQGQVGISTSVQGMDHHDGRYEHRLQTLWRGLLSQGLGQASGPHSPFMRYHVDAITLKTVGDGWHDEMSFGRVVEGGFRSINNLLEKLHQSFFLYMLLDSKWFVSIGTYLPSAMLIAVNFTITSIALWIQSGWPSSPPQGSRKPNDEKPGTKEDAALVRTAEKPQLVLLETTQTDERSLSAPLGYVASIYVAGLIPLGVFNFMDYDVLPYAFLVFSFFALTLPIGIASAMNDQRLPAQAQTLVQCFSLLVLGIALSTLSTLNFALGLFTGLLASPLSFVRPAAPAPGAAPPSALLRHSSTALQLLVLFAVNPITAVIAGALVAPLGTEGLIESLRELLVRAAFAWNVSGTWTSVIVWMVWWPAWVCGATVAVGRLYWTPPAAPKARK